MVILDEKVAALLPTPPAYSVTAPHTSLQVFKPIPHLASLPLNVLSRITGFMFPVKPKEGQMEAMMLWICTDLRLVCRSLYAAGMRVLRAYYLPSYLAYIREPYTSDPLPPPSSYPTSLAASTPGFSPYSSHHYHITPTPSRPNLDSIGPLRRETAVLDTYCILRALDDFRRTETSFYPDFTDAYLDLFAHAQPRARIADLVLARAGDVIRVYELDPQKLSVVLIPRHAKLVFAIRTGERITLADEIIEKWQTLESVAAALSKRLERGLREGAAQ